MSLEKQLLGIANSAIKSQQKERDKRGNFSQEVDVLVGTSYAQRDKKAAEKALNNWQKNTWEKKIRAGLTKELQRVAPKLKPDNPKYQETYDSLYKTNLKKLEAAKTAALQKTGVARKSGQSRLARDNQYRQVEADRTGKTAYKKKHAAKPADTALAIGASRLLRAPLQLAADVGENDDGSIFDKGAKFLEGYEQDKKDDSPEYTNIQENGSFGKKLVLSAVEQIPSLAVGLGAATAATKGAQLLGAGAKMTAATAYGTAAASMYPQAYLDGSDSTKDELENATSEQLASAERSQDIYKGMFDKNVKAGMSEDDAHAKARDQTISEIAEESGENVGLATLALSMMAPGVGSFTANRAAGGAVSQWGQKVFNKLAVKADASKAAKYAIPTAVGAGIVGLNVAEEGAQEGYTDYVAQKAAVDVGVKDKIDTAQNTEAVLMGGILGGLMGGATYVGTRNSKLHQAQDDLKTAQQAYAEVAGQIPQLQQQIEAVSPRSPEGQALTARVEETRAALDAMAAEAEKAGIPRTSLARRAPRIDPTNSAASDFDGQVEGATELSEQDFENALNPDGTPAPAQPVVDSQPSEQELDAQDAQIAELIAEQQALDEAIDDDSAGKPVEESLAAAQAWYDGKRGENKQGLSGVVSRAAAKVEDTAFAEQQQAIAGTGATINDYIAIQRAQQQQIDAEIEQAAADAKTERERKAVEQAKQQREIEREEAEAVLAKRAELAQPYEGESFDTTVVGADGAPFNLARFWDSTMPAAAKTKAIADAFNGEVDQNIAKAGWGDMPEGVQKQVHQWMTGRLDAVRQSRAGGDTQSQPISEPPLAPESQQSIAPTASGLTMPVRAEQAPTAPVEAEPQAETVTPAAPVAEGAATQLTDENPTINIPAPTQAKVDAAPTTDEGIYKSKPAAKAAIKKQKLNPNSVTINQVKGGGFEIVPNEPAKPSYAQAQEQAATELGMTLDENGEYGGTDAEFEAFANRVDEIQGRSLNNSTPTPVAKTESAPNNDVAIGKDGNAKWFGKQDKAQAFIDKNGISDTHEVVQAGKRFEIQPKAQVSGAIKQTSAPIDVMSESGSPEVQDLPATTPEVSLTEQENNQRSNTEIEQPPHGSQENPTESEATPETELAEKHGFNEGNKLDHGELSIPNRTKNIDNELDKYKADKAKLDAKKRDEVKAKNTEKADAEKARLAPIQEQAQAEYKQYGTAMVNAYKDRLEAQGVNARDFIRDEAKYNPESFLKLSKQFQEEQQAATQAPAEVAPETKKPAEIGESDNNPTPTGNWQTQVNGNEFRINEDGITVRKHDRVVHIRGASSIVANQKAKELANQDIRELHYIAAKDDVNDQFSEASIWLDGEGDMIRKKGTKKPSGALLPVLKLAKSNTEPQAPVAKPETAPETKKTAAEKSGKPAEQVTEIEDFGEKITGARKDMDSFYQKEITDDDILNQPLSKIWPKKDIDAIEDKKMAALATVLRGTIPNKPRKGYKLNNWVAQVKSARGIMQQMLSDDASAETFIDQMTKVKGVQSTGYHAQLLSAIEQDQWARVTAVDHRPYYATQNDDGSTSPDMSFDVTIDKRRHIIPTENKQISEVVDKVNNLLSEEVKTQALKFDLYSRGRGDKRSYFITQASDKDKTPLIEFNDRNAAMQFKNDNNAELSELWDQYKEKVNVKKTDTRSRQNRARIGPDHRGGQDVTTEQFMEAFGLRGGQFGNWVKQGANTKERQGMLNDAYDAFMDLANLLNIPSEAIGLGGKLGMSFGARGKGAAMAHYEPSQVVINLTKTKGAGTLAHEWFHALDHHFTSFRDSPARNKSREDTYITYKPEPSMMYTPQKGRGYLISKPALERRRAKSNDPMYNAENWAPDPNHPAGVRPKVEEAFADLVNALNDSPMKDRATTIDKGATDGYWSRIIERAARSFESYIIHKLEQQGARSDFLANVTPENAFPRNMDRYPYLLESEMAPVVEAFDNLFATIDSKASEDGNGKILFSRAGQMKQAAESITTNPAKGVTGTTSQQIIGALQKRFGKEAVASLVKSGKLRVRTLNDFVNADGRLLIPSDAEGFYYDGKVTLIADNLTTDTAVATLLHELGGHAGIQGMLSPQTYMTLMENFYDLVRSGNKYAVRAKQRAEASTATESEARDEYIPYLITEYAQATERGGPLAVIKRFVNRVMAGVRAWVRANTGVQLKITPNDITQLAERMVKRLAEQSTIDMAVADVENIPAGQMQFSQAPAPQSQVDAVRKQYEGTDEWMKAPNGLPSKLTELQWLQVRTPSFKNWFGDWENGQRTEESRGDNTRTTTGGGRDNGQLRNRDIGRSLDGPRNNGSGDSRNTGGGRQSESALLRTADSQRITKLDTKTGEPRVFLHGTQDDFFIFDSTHANKKDFGWLGVGNYFTTNDQVAGLYALNKKGGSGDKSVMNVYLNARNPFVATQSLKNMIRDGGKAEAEEFTQYLIDNGHDSVVLDNGADNLEVMVLDANQVKSATDNAGTFDSSNPDIRFSRRYSELGQDTRPTDKKGKAVSVAKQGLSASLSSWYITKLLMRRHLATPLHVSLLDSYFKIFHDNVQSRIAYENYEAGRIQEYLPEIWDTRLRVGKKKETIEKVARAYFDGTMADKVWTPEELAEKFNLDDSQQDMYYRTRQATDESLRNLTIDTISVLGKGTKLVNIHTVNKLKLEGLNPKDHKAKLQAGMVNELEKLGKGGLITPKAEARMQKQLDDVFKVMDAIADKSDKLIEQGYAPLMRFGHYAVEVRNKESNELDLFELYETKGEQDRAIKDLEKHYDMDKFTVGRGVLNPEGFKQFTDKGLSPETVQLFAAELGLDEDGAIQAYLKIAVSDRSALKRLIHRKKVPGYSEDMPRVLSAFVMSNARYSGRSLYNGEIEKSIQGIKDGNLQGEAQSVFDNMENPQEEFAGTRSMMFHHFMGFSLAFLTLNLTQPFTQTIPKLTAYVGAARAHQDMTHALGIVGKYMGKATFEFGKQAIGKPSMDWKGFEDHLPAWVKKEDYLRMSREGHLDPQNVWMIRGLERGKDGVLSGAWGNVERMAGAPAEVSESINRRGTMIAALKVAKRMGDAKLKAKGFDSAYDFAVSVIQQTQGVYNKGNRSGLARGNGKLGQFGPLVMVFKQFSINYVEQMIRHVKDREYSSVAVAMAWPFMLSGMLGLPFVDDLRDIFEGFLYRFFGIATNLPDFLQTHLGKETADILMYGYLSQKTPIDMYGRSSMGNFIPGTSFARPQEGDIKEILGASSSFFQNFVTGGELISKGQYKDGLVLMSPRYIKDAVHAVDIWNTGAYRNSRGDKIMDMSKQDAVIKGVFQFNPASNARAGRERSEAYHMNNMVKAKSNDFAVLLAAAMYQEDDDKIDKLYTEMDEWNDRNAEQYHIDIDKIEKSAEKRMEKKDFTSDERQNIGGNLEEYLEDKAGT